MPVMTTTPQDLRLEARQTGEDVITQTLARQSTTFIALVTLGPSGTTTPEPSSPNPEANIYGQNDGLSGAQIGAIVGSIVGAAFLIILIWMYYMARRNRVVVVDEYDYSSYETSYFGDESISTPRRPPEAAERIPGGPRFPNYRAIPIPNPRYPRVRRAI